MTHKVETGSGALRLGLEERTRMEPTNKAQLGRLGSETLTTQSGEKDENRRSTKARTRVKTATHHLPRQAENFLTDSDVTSWKSQRKMATLLLIIFLVREMEVSSYRWGRFSTMELYTQASHSEVHTNVQQTCLTTPVCGEGECLGETFEPTTNWAYVCPLHRVHAEDNSQTRFSR